MYTVKNFKTKKELKEAVAKHAAGDGPGVDIYSPGIFPAPSEGWTSLEGPHYPKPHTWYAQAFLVGGIVTKVK